MKEKQSKQGKKHRKRNPQKEITPYRLKGIYYDGKHFYTENLVPGMKVYGEKLVQWQGKELRLWDPTRSKLAAALKKGISQIGIKPGDIVLYLGASSGTTPSHVSDIVGKDGFVFALDFSPRMVRDLMSVVKTRENMAPLLEDAAHPVNYFHKVPLVDVLYQDIAQRNQVAIFLKNIHAFLKPGGFGFLCLKARSVDVTKKPKEIFKQVRAELEQSLIIVDYREIDPFEKDHAVFVVKKKE